MSATLDLRGVQTEPVTVIDRNGATWELHDGLPLRTALTMMELAPAFESGSLTPSDIEKTIDGVLAVFKRTDATITREKMLDSFDLDDLIRVIVFLATRAEEKTTPGAEQMGQPEKAGGAKILKQKR